MNVNDKNRSIEPSLPSEGEKRRFLSGKKKFQCFVETQTAETPIGELLLREVLHSTDLAESSAW